MVNAGVRRGRDAEIANMRAIADVGAENMTSAVIATRGERLVLSRARFSGRDAARGVPSTALGIIEINADNRIAADVVFDPDDIDAAFAELDARYLAGEAADHAHTWSVIAGAYAALNRHELPATTPDWVNIDRQRLALIAPGDMYTHSAPHGTSCRTGIFHRGRTSADGLGAVAPGPPREPRKRASKLKSWGSQFSRSTAT